MTSISALYIACIFSFLNELFSETLVKLMFDMAAGKVVCMLLMVAVVSSVPLNDYTPATHPQKMVGSSLEYRPIITTQSMTSHSDQTTVHPDMTSHKAPTTSNQTAETTNPTTAHIPTINPNVTMETTTSNPNFTIETTTSNPNFTIETTTTNPNVTSGNITTITKHTTENPVTSKTPTSSIRPATTTPKSKFSGASFGGGIVVGVAIAVIIILIVYFVKYRKREIPYDKM